MNRHQEIQSLLTIYAELDGDQQAIVDQHLHDCDDCRSLLAFYQEMDQALRGQAERQQRYLLRQPALLPHNPTTHPPQQTELPADPWYESWLRTTHVRWPLPQVVGVGLLSLLLVATAGILANLPPLMNLTPSHPTPASVQPVVMEYPSPQPTIAAVQKRAEITAPTSGATLRGDVPILGSADADRFLRYELFYRRETADDNAYIYFGGGTARVITGELGVWRTASLPAGRYRIRLRAVQIDGRYAEYVVQNLQLGMTTLEPSFIFGMDALMGNDQESEQVRDAVNDLQIDWVKQRLRWAELQPSATATPDFRQIDAVIPNAQSADVNLLVTIHDAPDWARVETSSQLIDNQLASDEAFGTFLQHFASHTCDSPVKAIEVWDEQNMRYRWDNRPLDAAAYVDRLRVAYHAIKRACPSMLVISGGLAPAGQNPPQALDNLRYFGAMLDAGVTNYVDALGIHLPGYNVPPNVTWQNACAVTTRDRVTFTGACHSPHHSWSFRSTLTAYQAALATRDLAEIPFWVTKFGWPTGKPISANYQYVRDNSAEEQALWTLEALTQLQQSEQVTAAFLFNLNYNWLASEPTYRTEAQWSILNEDGEPLPVYTALHTSRSSTE